MIEDLSLRVRRDEFMRPDGSVEPEGAADRAAADSVTPRIPRIVEALRNGSYRDNGSSRSGWRELTCPDPSIPDLRIDVPDDHREDVMKAVASALETIDAEPLSVEEQDRRNEKFHEASIRTIAYAMLKGSMDPSDAGATRISVHCASPWSKPTILVHRDFEVTKRIVLEEDEMPWRAVVILENERTGSCDRFDEFLDESEPQDVHPRNSWRLIVGATFVEREDLPDAMAILRSADAK